MRETELPYPGVVSNGLQLRVQAVKAISSLQVAVDKVTGKHAEADNLGAFFTACAAACSGLSAGAEPANTVLPTITGTATVGQTLTRTTGTWSNTPTGYVTQWYADDVAIAGASGATYVLKAAQAGKRIKVKVQAKNAAGAITVSSAATAQVAAA